MEPLETFRPLPGRGRQLRQFIELAQPARMRGKREAKLMREIGESQD
jgi:hypothetical protein